MSASNWIGRSIGGRYQVEALLGQGGMSAVYRALDPNLRRTVAVKLIHPHLSSDPEFVRRFEQEAAAVAQLRHPNIIQVFDFNHDAEVYYMVLEFVAGETLQARLKAAHAANQRLPLDQAIFIMATVCDAVEYAHRRGMIHRDLKPANVMLDPHGQPILMDFGVAKMVGGQQHTATGAIVGTVSYMSPEQIRGMKVDERADIYSLGIMLYEMTAGRPPFEGDSAMTVMFKHVNEPPPDIQQYNAAIPDELKAIIQKALTKEPGDRFATAADMARALRGLPLVKTMPAPPAAPTPPAAPEKEAAPAQPAHTVPDRAAASPPPPSVPEKAAAPPAPSQPAHTLPDQVAPPASPASPEKAAVSQPPATAPDKPAAPPAKPPVTRSPEAAPKPEAARPASQPATPATAPQPAPAGRPAARPPASATPPVSAPPPASKPAGPAARPAPTTPAAPKAEPAPAKPGGLPTGVLVGGGLVAALLCVGVIAGAFLFSNSLSQGGATATVTAAAAVPEASATPPAGETIQPTAPAAATTPPTATLAPTEAATPTPEPTATATEIVPPAGMALAPGGTFNMGSADGRADERPVHAVTLRPFFIDLFEVTNARYRACVEAGRCAPPAVRSSPTRGDYFTREEFNDFPVIQVTWEQAAAFCAFEGKRLPTEAEWEFAARGGGDRRYPWGDDFDAARVPSRAGDTVRVGSLDNASPFGVFDLAGNVTEWVADFYGPYADGPVENPTGPAQGQQRVIRGGSYGTADGSVYTTTRRFRQAPGVRDVDIGFRCAQDAP